MAHFELAEELVLVVAHIADGDLAEVAEVVVGVDIEVGVAGADGDESGTESVVAAGVVLVEPDS